MEGARATLASKLRDGGSKSAKEEGTMRATEESAPPAAATDAFAGATAPIVDAHPPLGEALPSKRIVTEGDLHHFEHTAVFGEILGLIDICNEQIIGKSLTDPLPLDEVRAHVPLC